jgi:pyridoxine 5-phosphate synthase
MSLRLHLNIDHVATVRNARGTAYPDPVLAAQTAELAGVDGITAHLREDRRHIRDADVARLRAAITTVFNLEMAATEEMLAIAVQTKPDVVTLVPERREERTTEGGLDVRGQHATLVRSVKVLHDAGIRVSLFLAPVLADIEAAAALGVDQVELHTGEYAHAAPQSPARALELARLGAAGRAVVNAKIALAAGHGLTRHNVGPVAALPAMEELNIGHAMIADALFLGLAGSVTAMREALERALSDATRTTPNAGAAS